MRFRFLSVLIIGIGLLFSISSVCTATNAIPYLSVDSSSYQPGETMEISVFYTDMLESQAYIEIIWEETSNIISRTTISQEQFLLPAPLVPGHYIIRLVYGTDNYSAYFTVASGATAEIVPELQGQVKEDDSGMVLGILLQWAGLDDHACYIKKSTAHGEEIIYGPIYGSSWIDVQIESNGTYTYTIDGQTVTSNPVVIDISGFVPTEYDKNKNLGSIVLQINNPYMVVNGISGQIDPQNISVVPTVTQGRVLLPIRSIVEEIGGTVEWNGSEQTVTISAWQNTVKIPLYNKTVYVNGESRTFDVPARAENGRTLVPIRHLDWLGCEVEWLPETQSVLVNYRLPQ